MKYVARAVALIGVALCVPAFGLTSEAPPEKSAEELALQPYEAPPAPDPAEWPDERLKSFMRELTDHVYETHAVTDPDRIVYGMVYEFYRDGRQIQAFGLDSMHDGAWLASAMTTAEHADPAGGYMERALEYQLPFYTHMLNDSHRIFPHKIRRQDKKPLEEPLKGWVPRGWDDGLGYDLNTGKRFRNLELGENSTVETKDGEFWHAYHTPSNHLAQDLADMLLRAWMSTRAPAVKRAMRNLFDYREEYFGVIRVLANSLGVMTDNEDLLKVWRAREFSREGGQPYFGGAYRQRKVSLPSYDDPLGWRYTRDVSRAVRRGEFPAESAWASAWRIHGASTAMELYFDDRAWPWGFFFFDLQGQPKFQKGSGKMDMYMSDGKKAFGGRGIQFSWVAAALVPVLRNNPQVWEAPYRRHHADEALVRMVGDPPKTDGKLDTVYDKSQPIGSPEARVTLVSDPKSLHVFIESRADRVDLTIRHAGEVQGEKRTGVIEVRNNGKVSVRNDAGNDLLHAAEFNGGEKWSAELRIPYTVVPGQPHWINGVDHGRYTVRINDGAQETIYMLSEPQRIVRRFRRMALGTIENWHEIWEKQGCIPSAWRSHNYRPRKFEMGDAGNYAFLIKTMACLLLDRHGTSDWKQVQKHMPDQPKRIPSLPESVLKAQGLE